jgi:hypothetical protein
MSGALLLNHVFHYNDLWRRYIRRNLFDILEGIHLYWIFKRRCHPVIEKVGLEVFDFVFSG